MDSDQQDISLIDYIRLLKKKSGILLLFLVLGVIFATGAYYWQHQKPSAPVYQSDAVIQVGSTQTQLSEQPIENIEALVWRLNSGFFGSRATMVSMSIPNTLMIDIQSNAATAKDAKEALADAVTRITTDENAKLEVYKKTLGQTLLATNPSVIVKPPSEAAMITVKKIGLIFIGIVGGFLGIFVGIFLVLLWDWWKKNKKYLA